MNGNKVSNIMAVVSVLVGFMVAAMSVDKIRDTIRGFYQWASGDAFQFYDKGLTLDIGILYYAVFGFAALVLWSGLKNLKVRSQAIWIVAFWLLFYIALAIYSFIDSKVWIMGCTDCENGIVRLGWNELNYNLITEICLLAALVPLLYTTWKNRKKSREEDQVPTNAS
jgi:hypothetical protein